MLAVPADISIHDSSESKPDKDSDSYLIEQCLQGDRQNFRHLYRRYQNKIRSTLYQLCGPSCLDDLVQEVFLRAWKGLPQLRQTAKFSTWIYRITWNVATDRRREFAKQPISMQTLSNTDDLNFVSTHAPTPNSDLMQLHYQDLVQRGLANLSLDHRSVLVLHDIEELPQKDVAEILAIPVGTVKSRLFRARAAMRQFLEKEGVQI